MRKAFRSVGVFSSQLSSGYFVGIFYFGKKKLSSCKYILPMDITAFSKTIFFLESLPLKLKKNWSHSTETQQTESSETSNSFHSLYFSIKNEKYGS